MNKSILVIEPDTIRFDLLNQQLSELNYSTDNIIRYSSLEESLSADNANIGIVLADLSGDSEIIHIIQILKTYFTHLPVIILSDKIDDDRAIQSIQNGAQDFLVLAETNTHQLGKAIKFAIERKARTTRIINLAAEYEKHFLNGPIPMWIIDSHSKKFLVVNNVAIEKYGYSREEFADMSLVDIRPKEDLEQFLKQFEGIRKDYYDAGYSRHVKKNGEIFYVHVYSHAIVFNSVAARLSFLVDVNEKIMTDRKNAELAIFIKEQKEQLDSILASISDAIWSRRADTMELVYANNAYYKMFGYNPDEVKRDKEHILNTLHPDDMPDFLEAMRDVTIKGAVELLYRYVQPDGAIKILKVEAKLKKGTDGHPDMVNGVTNDITQEKHLYDTIRNSEQKLSATINNTKDLIWSVNSKLEIIFCNKAYQDFFYRLAGVALDAGDNVIMDWRPQSFSERRKSDYQRAFRGESFSTIVEEQFDGNTVYFEISSNPIVDVSGKIVAVNCISRDITEQRKQLLKIQQQNEKLKEIAWIQSHKVRGPVASILGLIPLFDAGAAGNAHNAEILEKLQTATTDLDEIIKEIVYSINTVNGN
jgi:PAS domain S-box-containing protein